jgi:putative transposase
MRNPFKYFKTSPEIIRLAVMMYIRFPLSMRNVEDLLHERGIDITRDQTPDRTVSSELAS